MASMSCLPPLEKSTPVARSLTDIIIIAVVVIGMSFAKSSVCEPWLKARYPFLSAQSVLFQVIFIIGVAKVAPRECTVGPSHMLCLCSCAFERDPGCGRGVGGQWAGRGVPF